jgi:membrane peptidoglycan carboxypeptidase
VVGRIAVLSVLAGLLVGAIFVPFSGIFGVAVRDASNTFLTLKVPKLGKVPSRSEILDSQGKLIAYYYPDHKYRIPVSYNYIDPVMRNAIVAIEDSRFYHHGALDPRGTLRAIVNDLEHKNVQGGSDLAQQYIKNALVLTAPNAQAAAADAAPNVERKIRELRMAAIVEHALTPDQLLAAYLNVAYFENSAYGIQVAAERYFNTTAHKLTLREAAMLAGMVENPTADDPFLHAATAKNRRNVVLARMAQLKYITQAQATAAENSPLGLHTSTIPLQTGCLSNSAANEAFFCDYALAVLHVNPFYSKVWNQLNTTGGLKIYTTLNERDERAATRAVNWIVPANRPLINPGNKADAEVLIQPGTGKVRAIAEDRKYGTGPGQTLVDYAVNTAYDGSTSGVQTGSSSKLFTLITALKQGIPFGYSKTVPEAATIAPYYNCKGVPDGPFQVHNAEAGKGTYSLYTGTTQSVNVFYAYLEQKAGLCQVVKTAASMGVTRVDGSSLLSRDHRSGMLHGRASEDNFSSFTLGEAPVSPMSMAEAYATVAARGIACHPVAIQAILTQGGKKLPVQGPGCHRVFSSAVADAASHILQGVITSGTASSPYSRAIGRPAAAKTGTANGGFYAAFGGYTPTLAGYASVFSPINPTGSGAMIGNVSCYREVTGADACPGQMFGDDAPGATWQMTFLHAALGPPLNFVPVPPSSPFYSSGDGQISANPPKKKNNGGGGGGHGGGGGGGGGNGGGPPHPHF